MLRHVFFILLFAQALVGCDSEATQPVIPNDVPVVSGVDTVSGTDIEEPADVAPVDLGTPDVGEPIEPCEEGPIAVCEVTFSMEVTYPEPQQFVWLTGSMNDWTDTVEDGAIPMSLSDDGQLWTATLAFEDGALVQYKYLMGWEDAPEPDWVGQDWDFSSGSPNGFLVVDCGDRHCGDDVVFVREPWFQWPTANSFEVLALTDRRVPLTFEVEHDGQLLRAVSKPELPRIFFPGMPLLPISQYRHHVTFDLPQGSADFTVRVVKGPEFEAHLSLPARHQENLHMVVFGDTRSQHLIHSRVVELMVEGDPVVAVATGDQVNQGALLPEWDTFFRTEQALLSSSFLLPVYGNHDVGGGFGDAYMEKLFFTRNRFRSAGNYWADLGLAGLVVIEKYSTDWTHPEHLAWLEDALERFADKPWLFVAMHEPLYTYSGHEPWYEGREVAQPLFEEYGVDAVFAGHNHCYEHFEVNGIQYLTTGGGGAPLYAVDQGPMEEDPYYRLARSFHHFLQLDITPSDVRVDVIDVTDGHVYDTFTLRTIND